MIILHDEDDHTWRFLSGYAQTLEDIVMIGLKNVVDRDPTLYDIADLKPGYVAVRSKIDQNDQSTLMKNTFLKAKMIINKFVHHNSSLIYHPELGGLVSGLRIDSQEILYCDDTSLTSGNIRGGIPTMLPNPGAGNGVLPRHGITRTAHFTSKENKNNLILTLDRNQSTISSEQYSLFPYDFTYDLSYNFVDHGCVITQHITNSSGDQNLPIGFGLHPYFPTPLSITQVQHEIESDLLIDHHNDDTQVLKNSGMIKLSYPTHNLIIEYSDVYSRVWIWTPPGHDAICIEPVTHDAGDYFINPIIIAPGEHIIGTMKFVIEISP